MDPNFGRNQKMGGYCLMCGAAENELCEDDCPAGILSTIANGFTSISIQGGHLDSSVGHLGVQVSDRETTVTIEPKTPMKRGEIQYVDGHPIGIVQQVNGDGTVDVLLTPKAPVTPNPFGAVVPSGPGIVNGYIDSAEDGAGAVPVQYAKTCPECKGTGIYVSPITNKQSPCSLGCKIQ